MSNDPGSISRKPTDSLGRNSPNDVRAMELELKGLHDMQHSAIKQSTFLGMTIEEADQFEHRGIRIREVLIALGRNTP